MHCAGLPCWRCEISAHRDLLAYGVICALVGRAMQKTLTEFTGLGSWTGETGMYEEAAVLVRQQLSESGDYFGIVGNFLDWTVIDYLANGLIVGWFFYALGRFLIGAWVGRHGWITRARDFFRSGGDWRAGCCRWDWCSKPRRRCCASHRCCLSRRMDISTAISSTCSPCRCWPPGTWPR